MGNIFSFQGYIPVIDESAFIHPLACVSGNVIIGKSVYVGPGAVLRGDWGEILIEDGCNIQENCVVHMFPGVRAHLKQSAHIGHGAVIHGAKIGKNALVGMNSVVMDGASVGDGSIVGALSFVPNDFEIPERKVAVGNPVKIVKDVSDEMLAWKTEGTKLYQSLPAEMKQSYFPVEPLREVPRDRPKQQAVYQIWAKRRTPS